LTLSVLKETLQVDKNHQLHIEIPVEMGEEVEVIVFPSTGVKNKSSDSIDMVRVFDESGFAKNILNSIEEDCWNDL